MPKRERYLALLLLVAVLSAGWLLRERLHWQQTFYNETTNFLLDDIYRARQDLERVQETKSPERRAEAMARVDGHLTSAHIVAHRLYEVARPPFRKGQPVHPWQEIGTYTNQLLHYSRALSPDMTDKEVARRLQLVAGLEDALRAGIDGEWHPGRTDWQVDVKKLEESWHSYLTSLMTNQQSFPPTFHLADPPVPGKVSASAQPVPGQEGVWDLLFDLRWERQYTVWPRPLFSYIALHPTAPFTSVDGATSSSPPQDQLGQEGSLLPAERAAEVDPVFSLYGTQVPPTWEQDRVVLLKVLEGLDQRVTLRVRTGQATPPRLEILFLQHSPAGERRAVPVDLADGEIGRQDR